jgi:hypothetical protein
METWKDVPGYDGLYQVSDQGRIRRDNRIKKLKEDRGGYLNVWLSKRSEMKCLKVHRLVALAFIDNPENKRTVNHKDGNKKNNCVQNLEWATHSENVTHANRTGLRKVTVAQIEAARANGRKTCDANRPRKRVFSMTPCGERVEFESAHEAARRVYGSASAIVRCCKGKQKTHMGYEWGYC